MLLSMSATASGCETPGVWSNDASIDYTWRAAVDLLSGVGAPGAELDIDAGTGYGEVLATNVLPY